MAEQLPLPLGPVHNSNLFSNHWLENRLPLEPEWNELRDQAAAILDQLADLWKQQKDRVALYGNEQSLEQAFIQPVLLALGWKLKYQAFLRGRRPDYALFLDDASLDAALATGPNSEDFWKFPAVLADSKAWELSLDRPTIVKQKREYPPEQIKSYLDTSDLPCAILTNGRHWRLIPRLLSAYQPKFETYLECDLPTILDHWLTLSKSGPGLARMQATLNQFLRFYLFFSPAGFAVFAGRKPLIVRAAEGSSEYRLGVGEGLRTRVFDALRLCIEGFIRHEPNRLDPQKDMPACRQNSFTLLYRLLFIMYAEDRGLLPYKKNRSYTDNRSLGRHRDDIEGAFGRIAQGRQEDFSPDQTDIWKDLGSLFDLIDGGKPAYDVPAYNGGLFDQDAHPFLRDKALPDYYLARVIDQLSRAPDPHPQVGLARVDYRDLAIQHLGSIYEGLLEQYPHWATEPVIVVSRAGKNDGQEDIRPKSKGVPRGFETVAEYKPGQVFLLNQKGERRASGSYYTPNDKVDYIVENTLGPICRKIAADLQAEVERAETDLKGLRNGRREAQQQKLETLRAGFADRILALRVLDLAMGSGHFLLRVCQYLAEEVATNPYTSDPQAGQAGGDASTLVYWKRRIVEQCVYGVDLNPVAVELAKLALWLETASVHQPLTFLDHHLRCGNSLVGADIRQMGTLPGEKTKGQLLAAQVIARLPVMLDSMANIAGKPSTSITEVKQKEKIYRTVLEPTRRPLLLASDVWCAKLFLDNGWAATPNQYQDLLLTLDTPPKLDELAAKPWMQASLKTARDESVNCFHWQLEFPEVFFNASGLRDGGGFDAIVGNPPYDVLSDLETGHKLSGLKSFLSSQSVYEPSFRGKNNLYKLFVCQAMNLLADGGRLGFITPMSILGDDQAADLRRMLLTSGTFTSIDAFPQKDDPDRRVFREAKLSTAIWTVAKTDDSAVRTRPFVSRIHPANIIDPASPSLTLTSTSIPAYDPVNLTVVSASQQDWDLAVKIIASGRMVRLKKFAMFFQGEVNETNARKAGLISSRNDSGKLVTRGACLCLYVPRPASQGDDLYLNVEEFLKGKGRETKAFHYLYRRVGLQESCPQNNFRRIIASLIPSAEYCNHTINYVPEYVSELPLEFILCLLNSKLSDWYFRLGSTNAHISQYQLQNLPCPGFAERRTEADGKMLAESLEVLNVWSAGAGKKGKADPEKMIQDVLGILAPAMAVPPYGLAVQDCVIELVNRIIAIEAARGEIARTARSALAPAAQPYQDLIDRILYALAGLSEPEWRGLEERLSTML